MTPHPEGRNRPSCRGTATAGRKAGGVLVRAAPRRAGLSSRRKAA